MNTRHLNLAARCAGFAAVLIAAAMLAGCVTTTPPTAVHQPMTVRPEPRPQYQSNAGAIFQPGGTRPLFEDRRARLIGDTLVVKSSERTQAA